MKFSITEEKEMKKNEIEKAKIRELYLSHFQHESKNFLGNFLYLLQNFHSIGVRTTRQESISHFQFHAKICYIQKFLTQNMQILKNCLNANCYSFLNFPKIF